MRRQLATSAGDVFDAEGLVENQDEVRLVGHDDKNVYLSLVQPVSLVNDGFTAGNSIMATAIASYVSATGRTESYRALRRM